MRPCYLGIDPGLSGGLALLSDNGTVLEAQRMPSLEQEIYLLISGWNTRFDISSACLEKVRSSPQMSKGSIFTFGWGYGGLRMALIGNGIPFVDVAPQTWQKAVGVRDKTGARALEDGNVTEKKNRHKAKAHDLWPHLPVTHAIADALLIAEYCRRENQ